ncbi:Receptor-type guanylate cyclase gcy [Seminavis robusta]|uniref:Receptor-type guanylate cyclase gcy n=1 Tax=Seminavis robusta TaxID=568900 RepID=A0A9N8HJK4_9STRA|nr:Receptor-type guanylate cyclase gcy [Seminavis robusta]|eukprot:Sro557_g166090.1 Receptor-type guanylate cyclase gcy (1138) ;mRNA; r:11563-15961
MGIQNGKASSEVVDDKSVFDDEVSEVGSISSLEGTMEYVRADEQKNQADALLKRAAKDTRRVRNWRLIVTFAILVTAAAVTAVTFTSLRKEEEYNFETAFEQFSLTVADSAIQSRKDLRHAYQQLANTISAAAEASGAAWPFFTMPLYQKYAQDFLVQSRTELISFRNLVRGFEREAFEKFAEANYKQVIEEAHMIRWGDTSRINPEKANYTSYIWERTTEGPARDIFRDYYFPTLVTAPPPRDYSIYMWNVGSHPNYQPVVDAAWKLGNETCITRLLHYTGASNTFFTKDEHDAMHDPLPPGEKEHPHSFFFHPIKESVTDPNSRLVGMMSGGAPWDQSLRGLLPDGVNGIHAVIENNCGDIFTYEINGKKADFLGLSDKHEAKFDRLKHEVDLAFHSHPDFATTPGHCMYKMTVYPTEKFRAEYNTSTPIIQSIIVAATFVVIALAFFIYDVAVAHRNRKLIVDASRANAIVSQLFPGDIADKMMHPSTRESLKKVGSDSSESSPRDRSSKALAELYLETSIMFADISGFTAWSSVRSPDQVFELLETVYRHFDEIAKNRGVFKVETVGDCYVAATGIPTPRRDHALVMARFAREIMARMHLLCKKLEESLGPDTGDLNLRIGIHSGPVTAGVLRGDRARFQLFGDSMNVTSRMESSCSPGKILVSKEFSSLLQAAGKSSWLAERKDSINAKGKGELTAFWLIGASSGDRRSAASAASFGSVNELGACGDRKDRLVDWCCQTFEQLLKQIVARRNALKPSARSSWSSSLTVVKTPVSPPMSGGNFFSEVREIITLPEYDAEAETKECDPDSVVLDEQVAKELRLYVSKIADLYRPNHFHGFEHAAHVLMSIVKLMQRIVTPKKGDESEDHSSYGITNDPLTWFACAFSGLIHDVDHVGVSNAQLIKENVPIAQKYKKSVAEQNSLALSFSLLEEQQFDHFRAAICSTPEEQARFRALVVNGVMATDIVDKELKGLRNARWARAFKNDEGPEEESYRETQREEINRKATIVIEHLIQASDVSHMMQHWHVYRKWNALFFKECYQAYKSGRSAADPSTFWYKGEIGFFDFYIIPLAKKLKECGVFGVSSGEYLQYAQKNRDEWVARGEEEVAEMLRLVGQEAQDDTTGEKGGTPNAI